MNCVTIDELYSSGEREKKEKRITRKDVKGEKAIECGDAKRRELYEI